MSYESRFENEYKNYKVDFIELLDEVEEGRLPTLPDMRVELDVVYAQAAKADEYEAKAKAFDVIKEYITDELRDMRRVTEDVPFAFAEELEALEDVLDKMTEYESGELE